MAVIDYRGLGLVEGALVRVRASTKDKIGEAAENPGEANDHEWCTARIEKCINFNLGEFDAKISLVGFSQPVDVAWAYPMNDHYRRLRTEAALRFAENLVRISANSIWDSKDGDEDKQPFSPFHEDFDKFAGANADDFVLSIFLAEIPESY